MGVPFINDTQFFASIVLLIGAWIWGAGPERFVAVTIFMMFPIDIFYHLTFGATHWERMDIGHACIDLAGAVTLTYVALWANRMYTLWIAAFQILSVLSHLARLVSQPMAEVAYSMLMIAPLYLLMMVAILGLAAHIFRVTKHGRYRSWRASSNPLPKTMQWLQRVLLLKPLAQ